MTEDVKIDIDSEVTSVLILFLYLLIPSIRSTLEFQYPQLPFDSINSKKKLFEYTGDIIESGSSCIRKIRLFTTGHQGAGKTSLLHSLW